MSAQGLAQRSFDEVHVGDAIPGVVKQITHNQLVRYSGASLDFNPIHTDPDAAKAAGLNGVIAHGLLSMAFLTQTMIDWLGNPAALRRLRCRFSKMVRPGDVIITKGSVTDKTVVDGVHLVHCELSAEKPDGEVVLTGTAVAALAPWAGGPHRVAAGQT